MISKSNKRDRERKEQGDNIIKDLLCCVISIKHPSHEDVVEGQVKEESTNKVTFLLGLKMSRIYLMLVYLQPKGTQGGIWM